MTNLVVLCGNLTSDVEVKKTQSGKSVCRFTIAVNEYSKDKSNTTFIDCQAWEKTADVLGSFCGKGSKILLQGRLQVSNYESNGVKKKDVVVVANSVEFMNKKEEKPTEEVVEGKPIYEDIPDTSYADIKSNDLPFY